MYKVFTNNRFLHNFYTGKYFSCGADLLSEIEGNIFSNGV